MLETEDVSEINVNGNSGKKKGKRKGDKGGNYLLELGHVCSPSMAGKTDGHHVKETTKTANDYACGGKANTGRTDSSKNPLPTEASEDDVS